MKLSPTKPKPVECIEIFPNTVGVTERRYEALRAIDKYGEINDEGTIDVSRASEHFDGSLTLLYSAFGHHARIARYTPSVSEPAIDTVRNGIRPSGNVDSILDAVEEFGFVGADGTIDAKRAYDELKTRGIDVQSTQFYKNVGKYCRVRLPRSEYKTSESEGGQKQPPRYSPAHLDEYDCAILDSTRQHWPDGELPKNQYEAFVLAWKLRGQWDSVTLTDDSQNNATSEKKAR